MLIEIGEVTVVPSIKTLEINGFRNSIPRWIALKIGRWLRYFIKNLIKIIEWCAANGLNG